jgi:hypothetical protein
MIGHAFAALNLIAFILIWRQGSTLDRVAVGVIAAAIIIGAFAWTFTIGTWRAGTAALNLALFLAMWLLAERHDRWWLVIFCSLQLLIIATHLLPVMSDAHFTMSGFVVRQVLWGLITLLLFAGAWECWAARKFALEGRDDDQHLRRGIRRA